MMKADDELAEEMEEDARPDTRIMPAELVRR